MRDILKQRLAEMEATCKREREKADKKYKEDLRLLDYIRKAKDGAVIHVSPDILNGIGGLPPKR